MKTSLDKIALGTFSKLAKKLTAQLKFAPLLRAPNLNVKIQEGFDLYLWHWEHGFVKIEFPELILGRAILSALTEETSDWRTETSKFSHIGVHYKSRGQGTLDVYRINETAVRLWEEISKSWLLHGNYKNSNSHREELIT